MDALVLGKLKRIGSHADIVFNGSGEGADGGPCHGFGYFDYGVEIAGRADGKTGFDHVDTELLEGFGHFDFLDGVELTAWHLLAVAQGGVEYE